MNDDDFEACVLRFERAWRLGGPPEIADFLGAPTAPASPGRPRLLVELICIDLEFRWRRPSPNSRSQRASTLEDYVEKFPELISLDRLPLELIGEEYRARCRRGDRPSHPEFLSRFRARREEIRVHLLRIDGEIEDESADPRPASRPPRGTAKSEEREDLDLDVPLLSDRDFLLRRLIGAGRMGKVYEAWQGGAGRGVAVKFLRKSLLHHPEVVRRFIGESRTVAGLRHPNIVATQGLGRTSGGSYFLVMDLVAGPDLARVCGTRVIAVGEAVRWTMDVCDALEHAHERGVVHCDLKPANLLLDEHGRIRVTDFGLARSLTGPTPGTAEIEGTVPFMAPEQVSSCWGRIDPRTDIYGLGAVLFALLTGRPPFVGRRVSDILADVLSAMPVVSPAGLRPDLPESLVDLCRKCLSKAPEDRYQTVGDVRSDLSKSLEK